MTRVAILWHMHQPYYEDLVTREHILPWVRLHALKDYYGMAQLMAEFPGVRATFNLVPSLLVQVEAFAEQRAHDRYLELGMKPAEWLTADEVSFILTNFFHAQRQRMIDAYPRYAELLALRGVAGRPNDVAAAAKRFTVEDLRDLQVWQKLAWLDPYYLDGDPRARALVEKERHFSEEDKAELRAVELELLNGVLPAYRERAAAGQIEIASSPFYHPILPLLCDTDIYRRTHPDSRMPRHRFTRPDDAAEQLERAQACHARLFGRRPVGLWPSEGSVSDEMVPLVARAGFEWMATDEQILARTLGTSFSRDAAGHVDQPHLLYAPYRVSVGGASVACGFRDHALSDLIGFVYSGWAADRAADDFVARLVEGGRRAEGRMGGEEPTIFVILDGENAWEYFEGGGRPFLRALYARLSNHPELLTVTMADACRSARQELRGIFPGSWIDSNFYIWIGHQDDQRAWSQLAEARAALDAPGPADPTARARAREEILIAEGSDWFWWYGDDHSSDHDQEFDDLFRRHLRNVYRLLDRPVPDELFLSNISAGAPAALQTDATRLLAPHIDGEVSSYFEWLGAGEVEILNPGGAMHQTDPRARLIAGIRFGFDRRFLFVRLDADRPAVEALGGHVLGLTFLRPEGWRFEIRRSGGTTAVRVLQGGRPAERAWGELGGRAAAGTVVELAIPLDLFGALEDGRLAFVATGSDVAGTELERQPIGRPIDAAIPDAAFEARHWSA
jgi:alpha-amylase/alpha-mannosidase (GH57 family)